MLKTKEYYKILHFLKVESVDRIYPVEEYFYSIDETGEEVPVIYEGDSFLFETNRQQFSGLDYVEFIGTNRIGAEGVILFLNQDVHDYIVVTDTYPEIMELRELVRGLQV